MIERARFAPSPTGPLHIGGVRTALFNYLIAKKSGGKFILRIEDTDSKRTVAGAEDHIKDSLKWLGLNIDEGPIKQSERRILYKKRVDELLKKEFISILLVLLVSLSVSRLSKINSEICLSNSSVFICNNFFTANQISLSGTEKLLSVLNQ